MVTGLLSPDGQEEEKNIPKTKDGGEWRKMLLYN